MSLSGTRKFTLLKMLKNSARNCRLMASWIGIVLMAEKSHCWKAGPFKVLRPRLPNWPGCACWKAPVLNQHSAVRTGTDAPLCWHEPESGSPTVFGRLLKNPEISGALPCTDGLLESYTVNGVLLI